VINHLTLDGVMRARDRPNEDLRAGELVRSLMQPT